MRSAWFGLELPRKHTTGCVFEHISREVRLNFWTSLFQGLACQIDKLGGKGGRKLNISLPLTVLSASWLFCHVTKCLRLLITVRHSYSYASLSMMVSKVTCTFPFNVVLLLKSVREVTNTGPTEKVNVEFISFVPMRSNMKGNREDRWRLRPPLKMFEKRIMNVS